MLEPDFAPAVASRLDALFAPWNRTDTPGLIVGIRHKDQGAYRRAFGMASLETAVANSLATRMRIGSTSKHMLATLALMLSDDGLVDLDRPIAHYLPELSGPTGVPTIRQFLQHRGGTRCHIDLGFIGHGFVAAPEGSAWQTLLRQTGRNFAPDFATCYNNGGYHLVSLALSRQASEPLDALLKRLLFAPLGMVATSLEPTDYVMLPGAASLHLPRERGGWRRALFPSMEVLGEGGVMSTIDDMLRWTTHLRAGLWPRLLDLPVEQDGSTSYYGLGLMRQDHRGIETVRHPGSVPGGSCEMVCVPAHDLDIVIVSNGAPGASPSLLADQVVDIVLETLLHPPAAAPSPDSVADWLGDYGSPSTGMVYSVEMREDTPYLRAARYPVAWPLATCCDGWLATGLTGLSPIAIRPDDTTIAVRFAGTTERLTRLVPTSIDAVIAGHYKSHEGGLSATIESGESGFILHMRDRWGVAEFVLTALGGEWLELLSKSDPAQAAATLWFPQGWEGSFMLNSARTRGLSFERVGTC